MRQVVVTGLGFISSIGNSSEQVMESLRLLRHGFAPFPLRGDESVPVKLYGSIKEFDVQSVDQEEWQVPDKYKIKRAERRTMSPAVLYAHCAALDAIADARLSPEDISNPRTGLYSASTGSPAFIHHQIQVANERGIHRLSPFSIINSAVGTINFNLGATLKIQGAVCSMASACASAAHALGFAHDEIATGRQDRMIVIGGEDGNRELLLGFAAMRALSGKEDPTEASCPFDVNRSGFVGTGGAVALILESSAAAKLREASIYAEFSGWGQSSDGHSPATSHPQGLGLIRAMQNSLAACGLSPETIDYINAHGTSTLVGDLSELRALQTLFGGLRRCPAISSTKAISGHGLAMAGALEAGICCLAIKEGFTPGSAHIKKLDAEAIGLNIVRETTQVRPGIVMSNSSGFGGANLSLIFKSWEPAPE